MPLRHDILMDDVLQVPTNANLNPDGSLAWEKPTQDLIPGVDSHNPGANMQDRNNQLIHFVIGGGKTFTIKAGI